MRINMSSTSSSSYLIWNKSSNGGALRVRSHRTYTYTRQVTHGQTQAPDTSRPLTGGKCVPGGTHRQTDRHYDPNPLGERESARACTHPLDDTAQCERIEAFHNTLAHPPDCCLVSIVAVCLHTHTHTHKTHRHTHTHRHTNAQQISIQAHVQNTKHSQTK